MVDIEKVLTNLCACNYPDNHSRHEAVNMATRKSVLTKIKKKKEIDVRIRALADSIRKKHLALKLGKEAVEKMSKEVLKPVTDPLAAIIAANVEDKQHKKDIPPPVVIKQAPRLRKGKSFRKKVKVSKATVKQESLSPVAGSEEDEYESADTGDDEDDDDKQRVHSVRDTKVMGKYPPIAEGYIKMMREGKAKFDPTFGLQYEKDSDKWSIGNSYVAFDNKTNDIFVGDTRFKGSKGLYELLFMKEPDTRLITEADKTNYGAILRMTNAHRYKSRPDGRVKASASYKYLRIIKPLVESEITELKAGKRSGKGIYKVNSNKPIEYVYWNDVNELVDRLRLLYASKSAGNNAHDNEIACILQELKEEKIII